MNKHTPDTKPKIKLPVQFDAEYGLLSDDSGNTIAICIRGEMEAYGPELERIINSHDALVEVKEAAEAVMRWFDATPLAYADAPAAQLQAVLKTAKGEE